MNECKNCGQLKKDHYYKEKYCSNVYNYEMGSKQFIPFETICGPIPKNKGCEHVCCVNCLPDGNPSDECKIYGHMYEKMCVPSCSPNSPASEPFATTNDVKAVLKEDKDPVSPEKTYKIREKDSGSDISLIEKVTKLNYDPKVEKLSDEQKEYVVWMFKQIIKEKDKKFAEAVRKLKEDLDVTDYGFILDKIDKIFGEFI